MRTLLALILAAALCVLPLNVLAEDAADAEASFEKNASLSLLSALYEGQNTLVFSPLSLSVALRMAADGAAGETREQLEAFLEDGCPEWFALEKLDFSAVYLANAAFLRPEFKLLPDYEFALLDYNAEPTLMDEDDAAGQISDWVSGRTEGMIKDFMTQEPDDNVKMLLVNALSMRAYWLYPFNPANTGFSVFHSPDGDVEVSSMRQTEQLAYAQTDGVQSVVLPYKRGEHDMCTDLEMIVLLPEDGNLQPLIEELSASPDEFIARYYPSGESRVRLSLPNMQAESSLELKEALIALGVADAFDPDAADFSAMAENALEMDLHVSSVFQKTFMSVYESGTEAAAATRVEMMARGAMPTETVEMNVDRPYMMLIHAPEIGYVLFAACINNPA